MGVTDKIWGALSSMIKLEDKVSRQAEAMKAQQQKIEDLTGRVIRLEAHLELLTGAALVKRLKANPDWQDCSAVPVGSSRHELLTEEDGHTATRSEPCR